MGLFIASLLTSFIILSPKIREKLIFSILQTDREVLSQLEIKHNEQAYKILKVWSPLGLVVELYKQSTEGFLLLDTHVLKDKKDAHYKFDDGRHNLFLKDINSDGTPEIILPSIDRNMKARLNVFMFDSENEKLLKVTQH